MTDSDEQTPEEAVRDEVVEFLRRNFPQISTHGGKAAITSLDLDKREVTIQLGGACSGCGVSPMTTEAIKKRLPNSVSEIDYVLVGTDLGTDTGTPRTANRDEQINAPF